MKIVISLLLSLLVSQVFAGCGAVCSSSTLKITDSVKNVPKVGKEITERTRSRYGGKSWPPQFNFDGVSKPVRPVVEVPVRPVADSQRVATKNQYAGTSGDWFQAVPQIDYRQRHPIPGSMMQKSNDRLPI